MFTFEGCLFFAAAFADLSCPESARLPLTPPPPSFSAILCNIFFFFFFIYSNISRLVGASIQCAEYCETLLVYNCLY
jgi:hypothetical protein